MKNRLHAALLLVATSLFSFAGPMSAYADPVRAPIVRNSANAVIAAQPVILVDTTGAYLVPPNGAAGSRWSYAAASGGIVNSTTAVTIKAAGATGLKNCVTSLQVSWDLLGTATEIAIRDGAAGTVLWRKKVGTVASVDGHSVVFGSPVCGTAATLLEVVTLTASTTGGVFVNAQGYVAP